MGTLIQDGIIELSEKLAAPQNQYETAIFNFFQEQKSESYSFTDFGNDDDWSDYIDAEMQTSFENKILEETGESSLQDLISDSYYSYLADIRNICSELKKDVSDVVIKYSIWSEETASVKLSDGNEFLVQLVGGEYLAQMGCEAYFVRGKTQLDDSDSYEYLSLYEKLNIISAAEKAYAEWEEGELNKDSDGETFEFLETLKDWTVSATSSASYELEGSESGRYRIVLASTGFTQPNDYSSKPDFFAPVYFDSRDEAEAWWDEYDKDSDMNTDTGMGL